MFWIRTRSRNRVRKLQRGRRITRFLREREKSCRRKRRGESVRDLYRITELTISMITKGRMVVLRKALPLQTVVYLGSE